MLVEKICSNCCGWIRTTQKIYNAVLDRSHLVAWRRLLASVMLALMGLGFAGNTLAAPDATWLKNQLNADGSVGATGSSIATPVQGTSETLLSLAQLGQLSDPVFTAGLGYLNNNTELNTEYLSRLILVTAANGADATSQVTQLLARQNTDGGFGDTTGFASSVLDSAFALKALNASSTTSGMAAAPIGYLLSHQNTDGGWSDGDNVSSVYLTSLTLQALWPYRSQYADVSTALQAGKVYLLAQQGSDKLWNETYESALALQALAPMATTSDELVPIQKALNSRQLPDGSWESDAYVTALALQANYLVDHRPPAQNLSQLHGRVVDAITQLPMSGVSVQLTGAASLGATTASDGSFTFNDLPVGNYTLTISYAGYTTLVATTSTQSGQVLDVGQLPLTQNTTTTTGTVRGTVTDASTGLPLSGVVVSVNNSYQATTANDGSYQISNVAAGAVTIQAVRNGYSTASGSAQLVAGGYLLFSPKLYPVSAPTTALQGTVTDGQTALPLAGAVVSVTGATNATVTTDAQGNYRIEPLTAGGITISVSATGYDSATATANVVENNILVFSPTLYAQGTTPVNANTSSIKGVTVSASTDLPVSGATVQVAIGTVTQSVITDASGSFVLTGLPAGDGTLSFTAAGYDTYSLAFSLPAVTTLDVGQVRLREQNTSALLPDLVVTSVDTSAVNSDPQTFDARGMVTATIKNQGTAGTNGSFLVLIFEDLNHNGRFDAGDTEFGGLFIDPLGASLGTVMTVPVNGKLSFRDAPLSVMIDSRQVIAESNENNNTLLQSSACGDVDLTAGQLEFTPGTNGDTLTVRVGNAGATASPANGVVRFYEGDPANGGRALGDVSLPSIAAHSFIDLSLANVTTLTGTIDLYAVADATNQVSECSETNNAISVPGPTLLPDLKVGNVDVSSIATDPLTLAVSGKVVATIQNQGARGTYDGGQALAFYDMNRNGVYDAGTDTDIGSVSVSTLLPINAELPVEIPIAGRAPYRDAPVSVFIDSDGTVDESNETNNVTVSQFVNSANPPIGHLRVKAYIDGRSRLVVHGTKLHWHHLDWAAPGRHGGHNYPTYINGQAWYPQWPGYGGEVRNCNCNSTSYSNFPTLPYRIQTVTIQRYAVRYQANIIQQPKASNGYTLIVDFNDDPPGGPIWYDIDLAYEVDRPDLTASLFQFTDAGAGQGVNYSLRVGNASFAPVTGAKVSFYDGDPATGGVLLDTTTVPDLSAGPYGAYQDIVLNSTVVPSGTKPLYAEVDPDNLIEESVETNNEAVLPASAAVPKLGALSVKTDQPVYPANTPVLLSGLVTNTGALPGNYLLKLTVEDNQGAVVQAFPDQTVTNVASGGTVTANANWNTGLILAGTYRLHGVLEQLDGTLINEATSSFDIISASLAVDSVVVTDKPVYEGWDTVQISGRVTNPTLNAIMPASTVNIVVRDPNGAEVYRTQTALSELVPGAVRTLPFSMPLVDAASGTYSVIMEVRDASTNALLSTSNTSFEVQWTAVQALSGQVDVNPQRIAAGTPTACTFTTTNRSASGLSNVDLVYRLIDLQSGTVISDENRALASMAGGASDQYVRNIDTGSLKMGGYACQLLATVNGEQRVLAYNGFQVYDPIKLDAQLKMGTKGRVLILVDPSTGGGSNCPDLKQIRLSSTFTSVSANASVLVSILDTNGKVIEQETTSLATMTGPVNEQPGANGNDLTIGDFTSTGLSLLLSEYHSSNGSVTNKNSVVADITVDGNVVMSLSSGPLPTSCGKRVAVGETYSNFTVDKTLLSSAANADPFGPKLAPDLTSQRAYVETLLTQAGWAYTIVESADDFRTKLNSGQYSIYLLLNEYEKLDETTQKVLREAVFRGDGLVVAGGHDARNVHHPKLTEALGLQPQGVYPDATGVATVPLAPADQALWPANGIDFTVLDKVGRSALQGASAIAEYRRPAGSTGEPAAVVDHDFGAGKTVTMGFDWAAEATAEGQFDNYLAQWLIKALEHVSPATTDTIAGSVEPMTLTVQNQGAQAQSRVTVNLPAGATVADAGIAKANNTSLTWDFTLLEGQTVNLDFWVKLPETAGALTVSGEVSAINLTNKYHVYATPTLDINVLAPATLNAVQTDVGQLLATGIGDANALNRAQDALTRAQAAWPGDAPTALFEGLKAADALAQAGTAAEIATVRQSLDHWLWMVARQVP